MFIEVPIKYAPELSEEDQKLNDLGLLKHDEHDFEVDSGIINTSYIVRFNSHSEHEDTTCLWMKDSAETSVIHIAMSYDKFKELLTTQYYNSIIEKDIYPDRFHLSS